MKKSLIIELVNLPEEGKAFEGELDPTLYDLPKHDAQPTSPLYYDLSVQRFENELLVRGYLSSTFRFTCVRTNKEFEQTVSIEDFAQSFEIEDSAVNLTDPIREEILIAFPTYPRCDEADDPLECKIEERYLALDKLPKDGVDDAPQVESDDRWAALDTLNSPKNSSSTNN